MKNPYMQFWVDDYVRGVRQMSLEEKGLYVDMILELWVVGEFPEDLNHIASELGINPRLFKRVFKLISHKFQTKDGVISHSRVTKERNRLSSKSDKARETANIRWNKDANALPTQCHPDPNLNIDLNKAQSPSESKTGTGPLKTENSKKGNISARAGLAISKAVNAHSDALHSTKTTETSPIIKKLFTELLCVHEVASRPERLLGFIIQTRRREGVRDRVGYCIKLIKNPDHQVADGCLQDAKVMMRSWTDGQIDQRVIDIIPDKGVDNE